MPSTTNSFHVLPTSFILPSDAHDLCCWYNTNICLLRNNAACGIAAAKLSKRNQICSGQELPCCAW
jgi:hypothetical protein